MKIPALSSILAAVLTFTLICFQPELSRAAEFRAVKVASSNVVFLVCDNSICDSVGSPNGYPASQLRFSPRLRKLGAFALGATEVAFVVAGTAVLGSGSILFSAGIFGAPASTVSLGTKAAAVAIGIGGTVGPTVVTVSAASLFDTLNPIYHWKRAKTERALTVEALEMGRPLVIEFNDQNEFYSFVESVRDLLADIRPASEPSGLNFPLILSPTRIPIQNSNAAPVGHLHR